ncbi:uncharacterized protein LOC115883769 [Sitophilus oryzae]|uniref:Uncharacterized protein LOC115883769 n=1 Tax=Sitophilus oryzae TaxID=7048 RepID=A0A6J2Y4V9_SITOR|nr:uncharacterized protein LOC115883769 [Sitophilus oryzae]
MLQKVNLPIIENILSSDEFVNASEKIKYLKEKCAIDDAHIEYIAEITTGQSQNEKWFLLRKHRLPASNFGTILAACQRNRFPDSLFKTLTGSYSPEGVKAIQWGKTHEQSGIDFLKSDLNKDIRPTGLWLSNTGILGASPDGLIDNDTIVEIKYPRKPFFNKKKTKYIVYLDFARSNKGDNGL